MGLQQRKMRQQLEGTIKAARRDGYNRGIRAAIKEVQKLIDSPYPWKLSAAVVNIQALLKK